MLCPATLPDDLRMCTWRLDEARQLGTLRAAARAKLDGHVPTEALDDVLLVTDELASNGLLHGGDGGVAVAIHARSTFAEIIVRDNGDGLRNDGVLETPELAEHGRGLMIVAVLADAYGHYRREPGAAVWARLTWHGPAPAVDHP
ncbi:ATP-binding protein [Streptomyces xiamenensis]|uniref:ATP-binding protein n=1 Tax=Streptomyces xiamenensis TaxID=408015 RepID=UPI0035D9F744